jgi:hypothetical protein
MRRRSALCAAALATALAVPATAAASGVTTHAFMAEAAIPFVGDPQLRALLEANADAVVTGAHYPDGGYAVSSFPGGNYGEVSHWERFVNAYATVLRDREDCGDVTDPRGPCASSVAFLMGIAGHGIGDERWDWLFEPKMADLGESPVHPLYRSDAPGAAELASVPPGSLINTPEFAMDNIALVEHDRLRRLPATPPPIDDLLAAYERRGNAEGVTRDGILAGQAAIIAAAAGERMGVAAEYLRVRTTMPQVSAQYLTGTGGVLDVAQAAAPYYEAVWAKVRGAVPVPRVTGPIPAPGSEGVPIVWHPVRDSPGPNGGGSETRILASLTTQLDTSTITAEAFRLLGPDGEELEQEPGFPKPGPYGGGDGNHTLMAWPKDDLQPCTTYGAEITRALRDHAGTPIERPFRWTFRTTSADGGPCPLPPLPPGRPAGERPGTGRPATDPPAGTPAAGRPAAPAEGTPAAGRPAAPAGAQAVPTAASPDGHRHGAPAGPTLALRSLRLRRDGRLAVRVTCVGPGDCAGRLAIVGLPRRGGVLTLASGAYAVPKLRTQQVLLRLPAAARRALAARLRRGGRLPVEVRAIQAAKARGAAPTTTIRRFTLR